MAEAAGDWEKSTMNEVISCRLDARVLARGQIRVRKARLVFMLMHKKGRLVN